MKRFDPIIYTPNDGLVTPEIGPWGLKKYKLMGSYCDIFTTGMRYNWKQLVYIDLFAGAGYAKLKNEDKFIKTSALVAAATPHKFTKYIICEQDEEKISALQHRFQRDYSNLNVDFVKGNSNENIDQIIQLVPKENDALRFCFVDPFSLNLEFETIRKIAAIGRVDFLILLALQMDGKRNFHNYVRDESTKIDKFLGNENWRLPFKNGEIHQRDFMKYLSDCYDANMASLGYKVVPELKYEVRNDDANLPLYYLAFYSKNERGNDFYKKVDDYLDIQRKLF